MSDQIENKSKATEANFEMILSQIETVVKQLESGELSLENSLKSYERGIGLVRQAQERLQKMDTKIEQLMTDGKKQPLNEAAPAKEENMDVPF